jgi:hypothetical protein
MMGGFDIFLGTIAISIQRLFRTRSLCLIRQRCSGNANAYNLHFYSAIVAGSIASAVAGLTRGPGRNLMFGSTYWVLLGAVVRGG